VEVRVTDSDGEPFRDMVAGLLRRNDEVLLCHRHPERRWYPDVWDLPGGHMRVHEEPFEALRRELREELGIGIAKRDERHDFEHKDANLRLRAWIIDEWVGDPANLAHEEHDEVAWFFRAGSRNLRLAHPGYVDLIERALAGS
jgi:8-oxo-dGTP diphosphatase